MSGNYRQLRRIPTPGASRKRKERATPASAQSQLAAKPTPKTEESVSPNRLLAGYMAYEFLTEGTLLGQKFDPDRAGTVPVSGWEPGEAETGPRKEHKCYAEVATILKMEGAHIPGIVNPSQLASWIQR